MHLDMCKAEAFPYSLLCVVPLPSRPPAYKLPGFFAQLICRDFPSLLLTMHLFDDGVVVLTPFEPARARASGYRPDHVGGAQLPSHGQDAHGVRGACHLCACPLRLTRTCATCRWSGSGWSAVRLACSWPAGWAAVHSVFLPAYYVISFYPFTE
eukprot:5414327-Pleurochrysis_carterae.AAC.1